VLTAAKHPRWYVVYCKAREDARALQNLERQGFRCYFPTLSVERLRQGRRVRVQEALFPRYLFIQLDEVGQNWAPIRSTRGVLQLVRFHEDPVPIGEEIIARIRERLTAERPSVPYLTPGEHVRITEGAFAHLEAIFLAQDGKERVVLLMNILQREQTLSFPLTSVRKARMAV
jgi:transcriptional antiterminator RfaH